MNPGLREETLALRDRYDDEPVHSDHVAKLAVELFDALAPWHGLRARERDLLECAAVLHDIGWTQTVEGRGHHRKSAEMIRARSWRELAPDEVALVAQIARYHRRSMPQADHADFHALPVTARGLVMVLGGILRLADALDHGHVQKITGVTARIEPEAITIIVRTTEPWSVESENFERKRDMLEFAAKRRVICSDRL
jgi:exopolyphosphatase/guanosine-5'-triphosphate,3'-diphosphate pyrophosphatase